MSPKREFYTILLTISVSYALVMWSLYMSGSLAPAQPVEDRLQRAEKVLRRQGERLHYHDVELDQIQDVGVDFARRIEALEDR